MPISGPDSNQNWARLLPFFFLLAAVAFAACTTRGPADAPNSTGGQGAIVLQHLEAADPVGDVSDRDSALAEEARQSLDITRFVFEEQSTGIAVNVSLRAEPRTASTNYRCFVQEVGASGPTTLVSSFGLYDGTVRPANASAAIGDRQVTFFATYAALSEVSSKPRARVSCSTTWSNGQSTAHDETLPLEFGWTKPHGESGVLGPFYVETVVGRDECCNVLRTEKAPPHTVAKVDFKPNDLRTFWIWQNKDGIVVEANSSGAPLDDAHLWFEYEGTPTNGPIQDLHNFNFAYHDKSATKSPGGQTIKSSLDEGHKVRLELPWSVISDRADPAQIRFTVTLRADDSQYLYLDAISAPAYKVAS